MAKAKTDKKTANKNPLSSFEEYIDKMQVDLVGKTPTAEISNIPDIITFIEDDQYLGLGNKNKKHGQSRGFPPFPVQKLILKAFYRGSRGNEHLTLTDEEIEICKKLGLYRETKEDNCEYGDVLGKYKSGDLFRDLILVWGRRSGKDYLVSLIALYEAMKLLEIPGGDPYAYYGLAPGADITILTIAASNPQAGIAFSEIREKLRFSKYFEDKILPGGIQSDCIYLLTKKDIENNKELVARGQPADMGSIKIEVGHSNPDTLVGKSCIVLILDEVASYKVGTMGAGSGDKIYSLLQPATASYVHEELVFDEKGKPVIDPETGEQKLNYVYDGKVISISSPRGKEGKLWDLWKNHWDDNRTLGCRLPTWHVNPRQKQDALRREFRKMSATEFMCEFGAEFSGMAGESMFLEEQVNACFKNNLKNKSIGLPGRVHFAQLDPATNSHNYALVVVHKEVFIDPKTQKADFVIIVDHIAYWSPTHEKTIQVSEVDEYVCNLKKYFHLGLIAYDSWNSVASIQKLRKAGLPAEHRKYLRRYKMDIYGELEELIKSGKIKIPLHDLLRLEMLNLQRKYDGQGFKVYARKDGDGCKTDDIVDALAGACYLAIDANITRLPKSKSTVLHLLPGSGQTPYRSASGQPYNRQQLAKLQSLKYGGTRQGRL